MSHAIVEPDETPGTAHVVRSGLILYEDTRLTRNITRHTLVHEPTIKRPHPTSRGLLRTPNPPARPTARGTGGAVSHFAMHRHPDLEASEIVMDSSTAVMGADGYAVGSPRHRLRQPGPAGHTHFVITQRRRAQARDVAAPIAADAAIDGRPVQLRMTDKVSEQFPEHPHLTS